MRRISYDFTVLLLRRRYLNIACKRSCLTPLWKSSAPSFSTPPPFHFSQGGFLQFIQFFIEHPTASLPKLTFNVAALVRIIAAHPDNARIKSLIGKIISNFSLHLPMHQVGKMMIKS